MVKGVSDYGDKDKDDSYHGYASAVSALYMLSLVREYVTSQRIQSLRGAGHLANPASHQARYHGSRLLRRAAAAHRTRFATQSDLTLVR